MSLPKSLENKRNFLIHRANTDFSDDKVIGIMRIKRADILKETLVC